MALGMIIVIALIMNYCCCLVSKSCLTLVIPWTVARQGPLSMIFSRQGYLSGLLFPFPLIMDMFYYLSGLKYSFCVESFSLYISDYGSWGNFLATS